MKHSAHLAELLDATRAFIRDYVVVSEAQADALVLWTAHTHALDAFETTPFLAVTSPEKRCGKTRLLDALELVVANPWRTIMPSEAVLFCKIDAVGPTLLLDEVDAIFNPRNGNTEPLRALLNAGNRRCTKVPRCVGPTQALVDFDVFCAKVLAGIGVLPETIADRAIPIRLARKRSDETTRRFRQREALELAEPIHQALASWARDAGDVLSHARPESPSALNDRAEESWEPLFAIADLARGDWPERGRVAASKLSASDTHEDGFGIRLLRDIRDAFHAASADKLSSASLAATLCENEESPWGDLWGKPLDARGLARRLRPFEIRPHTVRLADETTSKGYRLDQFEEAFARYLGESDRHTDTTPMESGLASRSDLSNVADKRPRKRAWLAEGDGVSLETSRNGASPRLGDEWFPLLLAEAGNHGHLTEDEFTERFALHRLVAEAAL
jgi:hypothetical protein